MILAEREREREIGENLVFCLVKKGFGLAKGKDERVSFVIGVKEMSMGCHLVANPSSLFFALSTSDVIALMLIMFY